MATGFSTRSGPDGYRLNFDTDNLDYYLLMQKIARHCIDGKPAADVVEVTFCKDCRYYQDAKVNEKGFLICQASGMEITETDYCSYSEKKIETVLPKSNAKDESLEAGHD